MSLITESSSDGFLRHFAARQQGFRMVCAWTKVRGRVQPLTLMSEVGEFQGILPLLSAGVRDIRNRDPHLGERVNSNANSARPRAVQVDQPMSTA